ncbi:MAG: ribonuclease P protein component [Sediminibacterium sp.]|jgi:ribonuclease P protein component|nr:ribonuclease P protein component [Sediminibacterium sp.]MBX9781324.1 ribonuclease P protein component [Chitinophagaceae bacterium]
MSNQGLPKSARIKSRASLEQLFASGKSFSIFPIKIFYNASDFENSKAPVQIGVGVSARNFKKATERNRIKRLLRETYRTQQELIIVPEGKKLDVFFLYIGKELPAFVDLKLVLASVMKKLSERLNK